jgi:hypothetical protein
MSDTTKRRDRHLKRASKALHAAIESLQEAGWAAAELGDQKFSWALLDTAARTGTLIARLDQDFRFKEITG